MSGSSLRLSWAKKDLSVQGPTAVGRSLAAEVSLMDDDCVSRRHALLDEGSAGWRIRDLDSANGTHVNGVRIDGPTRLRDGDVLGIGRTELRVGMSPCALAVSVPSTSKTEGGRKRVQADGRARSGANSCPDCGGSQVCPGCSGEGTVPLPNREPWKCGQCAGGGRCPSCNEHVETILKAVSLIRAGNSSLAEATLHRALVKTGDEEASRRETASLTGLGVGAAIALVACPPLIPAAALLFQWFADEDAKESAPAAVAWKRADLLFVLAALYEKQGRVEDARRALVQAAVYKEDHAPTRSVLEGI